MKRYAVLCWLAILPTSVVIGGSAFLLTGLLTDLGTLERLVAAIALTLGVDLSIAAAIQAGAPTRVNIGPGERTLSSELPSEMARVVSGFNSSLNGRVAIRGENWQAKRAPDDAAHLMQGMEVNVVSRDGLMLVVSATSTPVTDSASGLR